MKSISKEKRLKVYSIFNGKCAYCGCDIYLESFHIDHINPLFRGLSQEQINKIGYNRVKVLIISKIFILRVILAIVQKVHIPLKSGEILLN